MAYADAPGHLAIGLDVGGTKVAGGVVNGAGEVVEKLPPRPAPTLGRDAVVSTVLDAITHLTRRYRVEAIGVGAAGLIDWPEGHIRWSPNNGYHDLDLRRLIESTTGVPTVVDNDANAAAWAEAHYFRDDPDKRHIAMLTVGTGLGGGLVLDGEMYRGASGVAAEVGHLLVDSSSQEVCSCGQTGCLESLASGTALARAGRRAAAADPDGLLARLGAGRGGVTGLTIREAACLGDPTALALFERLGHWLGVGAAMLVTLLDVRLIIIGGGLVTAADLYLDHMRAAMQRHTFAREHRVLPPIALARLGADAGWIGAAMLSLHQGASREVNGAGVGG